MFVIPLEKLSLKDSYIAGNKAATLGEIIKLGMNVPSGFVVSTQTFDTFLNHNEITSDIFEILLDKNEVDEIKAKKIKKLILKGSFPKKIEKEILSEYKKTPGRNFIVRSSALIEDSLKNSWAGQMKSVLITSEKEVIQNIKKCWAFAFSQNTLWYRNSSKKLIKKPISIAILIQKMLTPEIAGVGFSIHPSTNDENTIFIEAGLGHGKGLVSGEISPDKYIVDKKNNFLIDIYISKQKKKIVFTKGVERKITLPEKVGAKQFLKNHDIKTLSKNIKKLEKHLNYKVDIEWLKHKNKIYILQTRPITANKKPLISKSHIKIFHKPLLALSAMEVWYQGELASNHNSDPLFLYSPKNGVSVYYNKNSIKSSYPEMTESHRTKILKKIRNFLLECKKIDELTKEKNPENIPQILDELENIWPDINNLYIFIMGINKGIFIPKKIKNSAEKARIISEKVSHNAFDFILNYTEKFLTEKPNEYFYLSDFLTINEIKNQKFKKELPEAFIKIGKNRMFVYYRGKIYTKDVAKKIIKEKISNNPYIEGGGNLQGFTIYYKKNLEGKVKIISNFNKLHLLNKGDIIVTPSLSPEYINVIDKILGIITEEGGELSHTAILAREYKIPCIIGVKNATKRLKNGQKIRMNGRTGKIEIL